MTSGGDGDGGRGGEEERTRSWRKRLPAHFYRTASGREPVREWLKALPREERRRIGLDLMTVEGEVR